MSNFLKNIHPLLKRAKADYSDPNYAILTAIDDLLNDAEHATLEAKKHSYLSRATGEFLNEWGKWFGVFRKDEELDADYRKRIVQYVDIPRGTNQAIKLAVRRYLSDPTVGVEIYEPWRNIFYLNRSDLNGVDHLMGNYYRFAVITITIGAPFDEDIIPYLERFKPSGVQMFVNYDPNLPRVGEEGTNTAIPLLDMFVYSSESIVSRTSGLDIELGGRIQLSDTDETVNPFITNESKFNSFDSLTGSFTTTRDNYHLASLGGQLTPKMNYTLGEMLQTTVEAPNELYEATSDIDSVGFTLEATQSRQIYMTLNIDNYLHSKYYATEHIIPRTKDAYADVLGKPEFTLALSGSVAGKTLDFQAYNFTTKEWITLERLVLSNQVNKVNTPLGDAKDFLNDNRLMFTRLVPNGNFDVTVDYFALDYRTHVGIKKD